MRKMRWKDYFTAMNFKESYIYLELYESRYLIVEN